MIKWAIIPLKSSSPRVIRRAKSIYIYDTSEESKSRGEGWVGWLESVYVCRGRLLGHLRAIYVDRCEFVIISVRSNRSIDKCVCTIIISK